MAIMSSRSSFLAEPRAEPEASRQRRAISSICASVGAMPSSWKLAGIPMLW